ncbi:MAG: hypothetical protein HeimC2_28950 [Candidatus Heimdallarchaeota archaeon LC_2]|nr:MAG: hypothetical protein HeimC2_28950 [Candidatus Heimdallarchaeota archaeon LC_2]
MDSKDRDNNNKVSDAFANFAQGIKDVEKKDKEAKKEILVKGIEQREKINKKTLRSSRILTESLSKIRTEAGKSAFVGTSGKIKSPKFRRKDFVKLLARELLLIGHDELTHYGGIISKEKLSSHFKETRDNWHLRDNDIVEALTFLIDEQLIPRIDKLDKLELIYFIPRELSSDGKEILTASQGISPSISQLSKVLNWDQNRIENAVKQLVEDGLAIQDEDTIYFPGL